MLNTLQKYHDKAPFRKTAMEFFMSYQVREFDTDDNSKQRILVLYGSARRSQRGEVCDAMFLTQGFVHATAEDVEQRFIKSGKYEFIYVLLSKPTVSIFEKRIALL